MCSCQFTCWKQKVTCCKILMSFSALVLKLRSQIRMEFGAGHCKQTRKWTCQSSEFPPQSNRRLATVQIQTIDLACFCSPSTNNWVSQCDIGRAWECRWMFSLVERGPFKFGFLSQNLSTYWSDQRFRIGFNVADIFSNRIFWHRLIKPLIQFLHPYGSGNANLIWYWILIIGIGKVRIKIRWIEIKVKQAMISNWPERRTFSRRAPLFIGTVLNRWFYDSYSCAELEFKHLPIDLDGRAVGVLLSGSHDSFAPLQSPDKQPLALMVVWKGY